MIFIRWLNQKGQSSIWSRFLIQVTITTVIARITFRLITRGIQDTASG